MRIDEKLLVYAKNVEDQLKSIVTFDPKEIYLDGDKGTRHSNPSFSTFNSPTKHGWMMKSLDEYSAQVNITDADNDILHLSNIKHFLKKKAIWRHCDKYRVCSEYSPKAFKESTEIKVYKKELKGPSDMLVANNLETEQCFVISTSSVSGEQNYLNQYVESYNLPAGTYTFKTKTISTNSVTGEESVIDYTETFIISGMAASYASFKKIVDLKVDSNVDEMLIGVSEASDILVSDMEAYMTHLFSLDTICCVLRFILSGYLQDIGGFKFIKNFLSHLLSMRNDSGLDIDIFALIKKLLGQQLNIVVDLMLSKIRKKILNYIDKIEKGLNKNKLLKECFHLVWLFNIMSKYVRSLLSKNIEVSLSAHHILKEIETLKEEVKSEHILIQLDSFINFLKNILKTSNNVIHAIEDCVFYGTSDDLKREIIKNWLNEGNTTSSTTNTSPTTNNRGTNTTPFTGGKLPTGGYTQVLVDALEEVSQGKLSFDLVVDKNGNQRYEFNYKDDSNQKDSGTTSTKITENNIDINQTMWNLTKDSCDTCLTNDTLINLLKLFNTKEEW